MLSIKQFHSIILLELIFHQPELENHSFGMLDAYHLIA